MKPKLTTWIVLLPLLLAGCGELPLPEEETGLPVFTFEGTAGTDAISLTAGEEGNFMTTFQAEEEGVFVFSGELGPASCETCGPALGIALLDDQPRSPGSTLPESQAPGAGSYDYFLRDDVQEVAQVHFQLDDDGGPMPEQMLWDLGDGNLAQAVAVTHTYLDTSLSQVTVCLTTRHQDGCETSVCNVVNLRDTACQAAFQYTVNPASQFVIFADQSKGKAPFRYDWRFGDGYGATLGNPGYYYGQGGSFEACLRVEDANGCVSEICREISPDLSTCTAGFSYSVQRIELAGPGQSGRVKLDWRDSDGVRWQSATVKQPADAYFEILEASRYDDNREGLPTWKIRFRLRATVVNDAGETKVMEGEGVFALGMELE